MRTMKTPGAMSTRMGGHAPTWSRARAGMTMTPALLVIGSLVIFWASVYIAVILPAMTFDQTPSKIWRPMTSDEEQGHSLYVRNGCSYCHSLYVRTIDTDPMAQRIAEMGDYVNFEPTIVGTERTGPDLSQDGGQHPNDWHEAHFRNPRYTRPMSLMPSWEFLGDDDIRKLTAFVQSQGMKDADARMSAQDHWKALASQAYDSGADANVEWLHQHVPDVWRLMPNSYPADTAALERGKAVYEQFCINCHGPMGDGKGPAAAFMRPPPQNFTILRRHLADGKYIGGIFYYQVMNGITGTGMPLFKYELESEKIWSVSNYLAAYFVGYTDSDVAPPKVTPTGQPDTGGIAASYEAPRLLPVTAPATQPGDRP